MPLLSILLIVGAIALVFSFKGGQSAIWGGATMGLVIGIVYGLIKWDFSNILRFVLIGADVGLAAELFGWVGNHLKR